MYLSIFLKISMYAYLDTENERLKKVKKEKKHDSYLCDDLCARACRLTHTDNNYIWTCSYISHYIDIR